MFCLFRSYRSKTLLDLSYVIDIIYCNIVTDIIRRYTLRGKSKQTDPIIK